MRFTLEVNLDLDALEAQPFRRAPVVSRQCAAALLSLVDEIAEKLDLDPDVVKSTLSWHINALRLDEEEL